MMEQKTDSSGSSQVVNRSSIEEDGEATVCVDRLRTMKLSCGPGKNDWGSKSLRESTEA